MQPVFKLAAITTLSAFVGLTACSSGSGDGPGGTSSGFVTTQAEVTDSNAQDLSVGATDGAIRAVRLSEDDNSSQAFNDVVNLFSQSSSSADSGTRHQNAGSNVSSAATVEGACPDGGSLDQSINLFAKSGTFTFNSCDKGAAVFDGKINATVTLDGTTITAVEMTFSNFTVTPDTGDAINLNGTTVNCTIVNEELGECSLTASNITGSNGLAYQLKDFTVSGDGTSGFSITTAVADTSNGVVTVTTLSPLHFDCSNDRPSAGSLRITGSNGTSATVAFDSCSSYTVTVNGVATSYEW